MINIKELKLNRYGIDILNNVSLEISDNSVVCILGNENSGKSSILKAISGVYQNYYGEILIDGEDIKYNNKIIADILHEDREIDSEITVDEYLKFYGAIYNKYNKKELESFIDEKLKSFSIMSYKYTNINMLDIYDYKMVEFIRILINDPPIILFDDVFTYDNDEFNEKIMGYIKNIIGKKTLIFAARSLNYLEEIVTHIGVIENGSVVIFGDKESVYDAAEISKKVQVDIIDGLSDALQILKQNEYVNDIIYSDNSISFTISTKLSSTTKRDKLESEILNSLINNGIKVYSFKRQRARFEQLFERLVG
ncbi:MAG: ATP-binding cassette domain-containing protein [Lachnospiraceae bacterium]|nr:ATP-binding cassette domain-containing protein [Lachnospiraceae bacterium]